MAETKGRLGTLEIDDGGGFDAVGGIVSLSGDFNYDEIDGTDFDSAGDKEPDYGERQYVISVTFNLDAASAGQESIRAAHRNGTKPTFRHRTQVGTGLEEVSAACVVRSFNISNERNQLVQAQCEIASSGAITVGTQA